MTIEEKHQQSNGPKYKILVVDDHPIVRRGLMQMISREPNFQVCCQAEDAPQAMRFIETCDHDAAIIDISLKGSSGIELIKNIRSQKNHIPILVLSMHEESVYAERSLRAGANGYVMKHEAPDKVMQAIREIIDGKLYVSDNVADKVLRKVVTGHSDSDTSPIDRLSDRELEVFRLIGQGYGTRQIAEQLFLSIKTIESYRANIKDKMGLTNASELVHHAIQWVNSASGV